MHRAAAHRDCAGHLLASRGRRATPRSSAAGRSRCARSSASATDDDARALPRARHRARHALRRGRSISSRRSSWRRTRSSRRPRAASELLQRLKGLKHELLLPVGDEHTSLRRRSTCTRRSSARRSTSGSPDGTPAVERRASRSARALAARVPRRARRRTRDGWPAIPPMPSRGCRMHRVATIRLRATSIGRRAPLRAACARRRPSRRGRSSATCAGRRSTARARTRSPTCSRSCATRRSSRRIHPVNLSRLLRDTWDDIDAGVVFSLEMYEGFKHFHALRSYLDAVGLRAGDHRRGARRRSAPARSTVATRSARLVERLVEFMLSEHLASYFFRRLGEQAQDPVLGRAARAHRRRRGASRAGRVGPHRGADRARSDARARACSTPPSDFHHFGEQAVRDVPVAMPGDPSPSDRSHAASSGCAACASSITSRQKL